VRAWSHRDEDSDDHDDAEHGEDEEDGAKDDCPR
jgi:hypothetical protein